MKEVGYELQMLLLLCTLIISYVNLMHCYDFENTINCINDSLIKIHINVNKNNFQRYCKNVITCINVFFKIPYIQIFQIAIIIT